MRHSVNTTGKDRRRCQIRNEFKYSASSLDVYPRTSCIDCSLIPIGIHDGVFHKPHILKGRISCLNVLLS